MFLVKVIYFKNREANIIPAVHESKNIAVKLQLQLPLQFQQ